LLDTGEIEFGGVMETSQAVTLQAEDLSLGEVPQIGEDRGGLLPVVTNPSQREDPQTGVLATKALQQRFWRLTNTSSVGGQFGPIARNAVGVVGLEACPQFGQQRSLSDLHRSLGLVVQFTFEMQTKGQQFRVGRIEPIAATARDRLQEEVT